ncbi:MAG: hypothetical protein PGN12_05200 [Sphingomonas phyllosphaerae]
MLILAILLQTAAPLVPEKHSVLVPVAAQPCVRKSDKDEVVVCADLLPSQALPLPDEAVASGPRPVNRDLTGIAALRSEADPCSATIWGCGAPLNLLGMGTALVRGVQKLVAPESCCERSREALDHYQLGRDVAAGIGRIGKHKPAKAPRETIDLDEPVLAGRVHP